MAEKSCFPAQGGLSRIKAILESDLQTSISRYPPYQVATPSSAGFDCRHRGGSAA